MGLLMGGGLRRIMGGLGFGRRTGAAVISCPSIWPGNTKSNHENKYFAVIQ